MSLISLEHVSKIYPKGTRPALDDISLDVNRGDFVFLVGASGSGKTTLLSLLLREEEATKGEIHVAGNDLRRLVNRQVPQYRRTLGFIFQDYKLLNNKTVYQNVAFALEVIGTSRSTIKSLVPRVLETVGLTGKENNYPHELSGGEAQRVAIARAYVNHPQILLADEPTGNLDPTTSLGIMEVLDAINRTGTTIVMATHNEEIVNSMRKRVVELHAGKIVRDEREGSYDSALYFPDADVEQKSKAQQAVEGDSGVRAVADSGSDNTSFNSSSEDPKNYRFMSKRAKRAAQAKQAMDAVAQTLQNGSEDNEGIARLAQSVHSGRTGRYGEVFQPLETTMTWGRGLSIPPAPPVQKSNDAEDKNNLDFADSGDSSDSGDSLDLSENQKDKNNTENIVENDIENSGDNSGDNSVDNSGDNVGNTGEISSETGDYTESKESNENSKSEASKSENLKNEGDE
ncbi:cell division ATP-binding protein FtsE [Gardnerella vaginalis]|uniref:cell division ATP-binding protein FtsE n=1 Tax=Gardnerella vaginalis TaxID=2702 RepID=UPI0039F0CD07